MSNLIHSSTISTPESIGAATRIKADMLSATVEDLINVAHICDESQILRKRFPIVTEVLSLADSKAESSSFQHLKSFKGEGSLTP
jgi:hypothetical protein